MRKGLRRRFLRLSVVAVGMLAGATGVAFATGTLASIVGSDGVIHGCYQKVNGQLRVVEEGTDCRPSELAISWSQEGPQGLQGEQGPQGEPGPPGPPGQDAEVGCDLERRIKAALPGFQLSPECVLPPQEGDACDDGDDGTYDDRIRDGECSGLPVPDCDDGDPNTLDTFDATTGACTHTPIQVPEQEVCDGIDNDLDGIVDNVPPRGVPNGTIVCVGAQEQLVCNAGFTDADGDLENGCESPIQVPEQEVCDGIDNDLDGIVDNVPPRGVPNGTIVCAGAQEQLVCNSGFADGDGNAENGCEVNLMTDPNNCGALGNVVSIPNATGACVNGLAVLVACHPGWFDANGSIVDGCELRADAFEPNDTMASAVPRPFGSLVANIAPAGNEDWFRYTASCSIFSPCSISFQVTAAAPIAMQVFEDGVPVGGGLSVNLGTRLTSHTYHVRITAPGFVTSYTLTAND